MPKKIELIDRDGKPVERTVWTEEEIRALPAPTLGMTFNDLGERDILGYTPPLNFPNLDKPAFEVMAHQWQPGESLVHDVVIVRYRDPGTERDRALESLVNRVQFSRTALFHHNRWEYLRTFFNYLVAQAIERSEDLGLIFDEDLEKSYFKNKSRAALFLAICDDLKPSTKLSEIPLHFALRPIVRKYIETNITQEGMTVDRAIREDGRILLSFDDDIEDDDQIDEEGLGKKEKRITAVQYSLAKGQATPITVIDEAREVEEAVSRLPE